MLEACGKFAWNMIDDCKMPNYWHVLSLSVGDSDNLFKSHLRNYSLPCCEKEEVLVNLQNFYADWTQWKNFIL